MEKKRYLCTVKDHRGQKALFFGFHTMRKDAGAVDRGGLENRCALTGTQGSNPCLSAH